MKTPRRSAATVLAGMSAVMIMGLDAVAHPGSHVGANHNHFFGGGEVLVLSVAAAAAAVLLYKRRG